MSHYAWIITHDLVSEDGEPDARGTSGPHDITSDQVYQLKAGRGEEFRLLDDDDIPMAIGRYLGPDDESLFAPLDDYGAWNWGCTKIQYREGGRWVTL